VLGHGAVWHASIMSAVSSSSPDQSLAAQTVIDYATGIDGRDWSLYRSCFADPCWFDFSSFMGTPGSSMSADDWVERVRSVNGNFDATQHQMTNITVTPTENPQQVSVRVELRAQHWFSPATMASFGRPDDVSWCELGGHYLGRLHWSDDRWLIAEWSLTVRWRLGDMAVFGLARNRPSQS
jgi:hypothetical protein